MFNYFETHCWLCAILLFNANNVIFLAFAQQIRTISYSKKTVVIFSYVHDNFGKSFYSISWNMFQENIRVAIFSYHVQTDFRYIFHILIWIFIQKKKPIIRPINKTRKNLQLTSRTSISNCILFRTSHHLIPPTPEIGAQ